MHQLFSSGTRTIILLFATVLLILFCLNNFLWNLPVVDFRPFKVGTNLYEKREAEQQAAASVKITGWKLQNKQTGTIVELPSDVYLAELAKYPKTDWTVLEQIKTKPAIEATKVSDFSITDQDGNDVAEDILTDSGDVFLIVAYKLNGDSHVEDMMVPDTIWRTDTVRTTNDSIMLVKNAISPGTKKVSKEVYQWDQAYVKKYTEKVNPLMDDVRKQGAKVYAIAGGAGSEKENSFKEAIGSTYNWYEADDILLKTMIRSNPGVIHMKAGKVLEMWHISHLPAKLKLK